MQAHIHVFGMINNRFITASYLEEAVDDSEHAKQLFLQENWAMPGEDVSTLKIVHTFRGVYEPTEIL